ncbi:phage tail protein [Neolewinella antarctica]|uniref:Microcystin-dependent protein n=1 Tax=Neolewinella antarctica TaxID=442734 RepID=A0ABX0XC61_9BACT|nr:tail fiber protein [Neolewinella antarctica]NJC26851.1 microcystin-dependent protein [Neolewinella antarctica]
MPTSILGQIDFWPLSRIPSNYRVCDGSLLRVKDNSSLFSLLGTTYGGDGRETFALPDLRGRLPVGAGSVAGRTTVALGQRGGLSEAVLEVSNLPPHTHTNPALVLSSGTPETKVGKNGFIASQTPGTFLFSGTAAPDATLAADALRVEIVGNTDPVNIQSPVLTLVATICVSGIFPSRR